MIAALLISIIIAGCLYYVLRELHKQAPRNTRRHFGV